MQQANILLIENNKANLHLINRSLFSAYNKGVITFKFKLIECYTVKEALAVGENDFDIIVCCCSLLKTALNEDLDGAKINWFNKILIGLSETNEYYSDEFVKFLSLKDIIEKDDLASLLPRVISYNVKLQSLENQDWRDRAFKWELLNLLDCTNIGLIVLDSAGEIYWSNKLGFKLTNVDIFSDDNKRGNLDLILDKISAGENSCKVKVSNRYLSITYKKKTLNSTEYLLLTIRDISEEQLRLSSSNLKLAELDKKVSSYRKNNLQLRQKILSLKSQYRTRSLLFAGLSHEIRTPLTSIIGFADLVSKENQTLVDKNQAIQSIMRNCNLLLDLVSNVMDVSRVEGEFIELNISIVSPFLMVSEIERIIRLRTESKGLYFDIEYFYPLPEKIFVDATRIKQILLNLLGNALKFTIKGGIKLNMHYDPSIDSLYFDIIDSGIGIPSQIKNNLFQIFKKGENHQQIGYGLGLYLSQRLAQLMKGDIKLLKTNKNGSHFSLAIPIRQNSNQIIRMVDSLPPINLEADFNAKQLPFTYYSGTALLIDDAPDTRKLLYLILKTAGLDVLTAINGKEALNAFKSNQIDIVITDIHMPLLNGPQTAKALRESGYEGPIIVTSADTSTKSIQSIFKDGCNEFIAKPFKSDDFYKIMSKYLKARDRTESIKNVEPVTIPNFLLSSNDGKELVRDFFNLTEERLKLIRIAIFKGNAEEVVKIVHHLQAAGTFGFSKLSEKAKHAFNMLTNNKFDSLVVNDSLNDLITQVELTLQQKSILLSEAI
jgi:signal transduction histidine kinase/CheY-like chemotaxis protein